MTAVFVDTGAWIAILSAGDRQHLVACEHYQGLAERGARLLTSNYVIDETATRLRYGAGLQAALGFRDLVDKAVAGQRLRVLWVDETVERAGWDILRQYAEVKLSLTDAVSAALARRARLTEFFCFDHDFEALGFVAAPFAR